MSKKVLVAEGDSWFALSKIPIGSLERPITDVINELKKIEDEEEKLYDVKSVADKGDTIDLMAYSEDQFDKFKEEIEGLNEPPRAILLSGGGNDITGKALEMMLNHKKSDSYSVNPLNYKVVEGVIDDHLREAYLKLLNKINALCKAKFNNADLGKIPVLVHGYAYSIPTGKGFNIVRRVFRSGPGRKRREIPITGPWLQPAFEERGYVRLEEKTSIMKKLSDHFNCMLQQLDPNKDSFSNIYVRHVNLRKCWETKLQDDDYEKYWDDELHPSKRGFKLIARKFHCVIQNLPTIPVQEN